MRTLYLCLTLYVVVAVFVYYRSIKITKAAGERIDGLVIFFPFIISSFITLGISILLTFLSSNVTTVYEKDGAWKYDTSRYFAYYSFNQDGLNVSCPAKWCGNSLFNLSDKTIVLHPVVYGNPKTSAKERHSYTIKPNEFIRVPDYPNYFFERVPDSISYKTKGSSSGRIKWVLLEEGKEVEGQIHINRSLIFEPVSPYVD